MASDTRRYGNNVVPHAAYKKFLQDKATFAAKRAERIYIEESAKYANCRVHKPNLCVAPFADSWRSLVRVCGWIRSRIKAILQNLGSNGVESFIKLRITFS